MSLKPEQLDDLIARGQKLIGKTMVIRNKEFKLSSIGVAELISAKGDPERYSIIGNLVAEDGAMLQNPLKKIVTQIEKNATK